MVSGDLNCLRYCDGINCFMANSVKRIEWICRIEFGIFILSKFLSNSNEFLIRFLRHSIKISSDVVFKNVVAGDAQGLTRIAAVWLPYQRPIQTNWDKVSALFYAFNIAFRIWFWKNPILHILKNWFWFFPRLFYQFIAPNKTSYDTVINFTIG